MRVHYQRLTTRPTTFRRGTYIGKSLLIKGEVIGSEPKGRIEGPISLPGNHVNIGRDGVVMSDVQAGEVIVRGT